jgi:hypothetical protein
MSVQFTEIHSGLGLQVQSIPIDQREGRDRAPANVRKQSRLFIKDGFVSRIQEARLSKSE